jgi:hypothetical protein
LSIAKDIDRNISHLQEKLKQASQLRADTIVHPCRWKSSTLGNASCSLFADEIANNNQRLNRQSLRWNERRVRSFFFDIKPGGVGLSGESEN